ncbi:MAG: gluconolaconase [Acidobacteria bacterium]|nr:gluconolaconase [Acidobacteriota bacterium]
MSVRRLGAFSAAALVVMLGAAGALWLWIFHEPQRPLEPGWEAAVITIAGGGVSDSARQDPYAIRFSDPFGIASAADGTIYLADGVGAHRIYRISPAGVVTTLAGSDPGFVDGRSPNARFSAPSGLAVGADGAVYVADTGNDAIRRISPDGTVTTIAAAGLNGPVGLAVDSRGRIVVADTYNDRIVAVGADGAVTPIAGGGPGFEDGGNARFDTPCGVSVDAAGSIYVADSGNGAVRLISPDRIVSTIATGSVDAPLRPLAVAVAADGSVFVADAGGRVVEITANGGQRTVAGSRRGFADGAGPDALFRTPSGIAVTAPGRLIVADRRNGVVRLVAARSQLEPRPPAPPFHPRFDAQAFDRTPLLWPFAPVEGPFEVTGTLGEPRGAEGAERLHAGLDVHAPEGTPVRIVRDGVSDDPLAATDFGSLSESVRIGPVAYVHLRVGRDARGRSQDDERFVVTRSEAGEATGVRLKRGSRFASGEVIGTVNRFYHAHLNVGWPGEELNPLRFRLPGFEDTVPPAIVRGGVRVIGADGLPFTRRERRRIVVQGRVRVVVDAWDQVNGNQPRRRLGLYRLGYQVLDAAGVPLAGFEEPLETIRFDRHPTAASAARIIYASGSGIPVYGRRSTRFLYVVTSTLHNGVAADGVLDTKSLVPGDYTIRILAADISGNEAISNRDLAITVPGTPAQERDP